MTIDETRTFLNNIYKKYPRFIENANKGLLLRFWSDAMKNYDLDAALNALEEYKANFHYAPKPKDIIKIMDTNRPFDDAQQPNSFPVDQTMRHLAGVYAEIRHLSLPMFNDDMAAYTWMGEQEKLR